MGNSADVETILGIPPTSGMAETARTSTWLILDDFKFHDVTLSEVITVTPSLLLWRLLPKGDKLLRSILRFCRDRVV